MIDSQDDTPPIGGDAVRFLHTSDWQLGMTRRFLSAEGRERFKQARLDVIGRIGEIARQAAAQFVVVAGDVFQDNMIDRRTVIRCCEAVASIDCPVLFLPGNHDALQPGSVWTSVDWQRHAPPNAIVLDRPGSHQIPGVDGTTVVAAPWHSRRPGQDPIAEALRLAVPAEPGERRILVAHGQDAELSGGMSDACQIPREPLESALATGELSYVALGDRHSCAAVGGSGRIWYAGTPEVTSSAETDPGQVLSVRLGATDCEVQAHRVGQWRMLAHRAEVDGAESLAELEGWLADQPTKERSFVRLGVTATLPIGLAARLDAMVDTAAEVFAGVARWERHWEVRVEAAVDDLDAIARCGPVRTAAEELAAAAAAGDAEAGAALTLLRRCCAADAVDGAEGVAG